MAFLNKKTAIIIGASTAVGFIGDVMTYSVAASKGGKFRIAVPKGRDLVNVLVLGIVGGFILDYALKGIENALKTKEEKLLDDLVEKEKVKIEQGQIVNKNPREIIWA